MTYLDPDRFFDQTTPGAHEWWYFDAISADGRDALVIVWYAGLPFDPAYGVPTLRHLRDPARFPAPRALDHAAIGISWYRDGKTLAYALNGHGAEGFEHQAEPFSIRVGPSRFVREAGEYRLCVETPAVDGKRAIQADLRFIPAAETEAFERDLGSPERPHHWILAASDCRVEGRVSVGRESLEFRGRGYHDHNAGAEDLRVAIRRWEWGRVHRGRETEIFYTSEPTRGASQSLWLTCVDGRPVTVREGVATEASEPARNVFGVRHGARLTLSQGDEALIRRTGACVDDGPFYRRWLTEFSKREGRDTLAESSAVVGISEVLAPGNLHKVWFNWMIPYRLKRLGP